MPNKFLVENVEGRLFSEHFATVNLREHWERAVGSAFTLDRIEEQRRPMPAQKASGSRSDARFVVTLDRASLTLSLFAPPDAEAAATGMDAPHLSDLDSSIAAVQGAFAGILAHWPPVSRVAIHVTAVRPFRDATSCNEFMRAIATNIPPDVDLSEDFVLQVNRAKRLDKITLNRIVNWQSFQAQAGYLFVGAGIAPPSRIERFWVARLHLDINNGPSGENKFRDFPPEESTVVLTTVMREAVALFGEESRGG